MEATTEPEVPKQPCGCPLPGPPPVGHLKECRHWPPNICKESPTPGGPHRAFMPGVRPTPPEGGEGPGLALGNPDGFVVLTCLNCKSSWRAFLPWGLKVEVPQA